MCILGGVGCKIFYFNVDLVGKGWLLFLVIGMILGGVIVGEFLVSLVVVGIFDFIIVFLEERGMSYFVFDSSGRGFMFISIFNWINIVGIIVVLVGGFLVGFGVCYGRGCIFGYVIIGMVYL